jgi:hypothetical protein
MTSSNEWYLVFAAPGAFGAAAGVSVVSVAAGSNMTAGWFAGVSGAVTRNCMIRPSGLAGLITGAGNGALLARFTVSPARPVKSTTTS